MKNKSLWPLGITLAYVLFAAGLAVMIFIACAHKSDLVSANYYEQEVKYQTRLDQLNRTAHISDQVKVVFDHNARRVSISLPAIYAGPETLGRVQFYRPSAAGLDHELKLNLDANGSQSLDATALEPGLWKVRIQWVSQEQEYFVDKSIVVKRGDGRRTGVAPVSKFNPLSKSIAGNSAENDVRAAANKLTMETGATPVLR